MPIPATCKVCKQQFEWPEVDPDYYEHNAEGKDSCVCNECVKKLKRTKPVVLGLVASILDLPMFQTKLKPLPNSVISENTMKEIAHRKAQLRRIKKLEKRNK